MPFARFLRRSGAATVLRGALRYVFGKRGQRRVKGMRLFYGTRMRILSLSVEPIGKLAREEEVRLWVDGKEAFPRIETLIRRARSSVVVQMFIWKDDETGKRIASALLEAADRGVKVDITKEAVGDFFEFNGDFLGTKHSPAMPWKRFWTHPNIRVTYATNGDHAKVYVIDDQILVLTGMNVADEYRYSWHDYMVELRGSAFVERYLARNPDALNGKSVQVMINTDDEKGIRPVVMQLLAEAKESLIIEHCYLSDPDVLDAIIAASKREVSVTVLLPHRPDFHHHANMQSVGRMLAEGDTAFLRVLLFPGMFHAKIILADHETAFLGSANLMKSSLDEMGEVNVLIRGKRRALWKLQETLRRDTLHSRALSSPPSFLWLSRWLAWIGL
jgi:cardiolipin synthase